MTREPERRDELPESGMGGASDMGAGFQHPASAPRAPDEFRPGHPEETVGDAAIERRHGADPSYRGPERRIGRR